MTVTAATNATGTSLRTGTTTVAGVDEDAGTITLTSAAAITSFADNDFLFRDGDPGTCVEGLEVCTPLIAPVLGSDSFRGKDRGADPRRLSGARTNDTTTLIEENAGLTAIKINQAGKKANQYYLNPINFWQVARRLNAKVEYEGGGGDVAYGFQSMAIHTPAGVLKCFSDPDCPVTRGRLINSEGHYMFHLYDLPHVITDDGRPNLRQTTSDGIEARIRSFSNYIQTVPSAFGVHSI